MNKWRERSKIFVVALAMILTSTSTLNSNVIHAEDLNVTQETQMVVKNDNGEDVTIIIEDQSVEVTDQAIDDILGDYPDAECITIYEVGYSTEGNTPSPMVWDPPLFHSDKYETDKTVTVSEREVSDKFVISAARGETVKLTSSWSSTLSASISGSYFDRTNLGITSSITASYTTEYSFAGPPESSSSNSREYRVKFYQIDGTYIQRHYVYYWPSGDLYGIESHGGSYTEPTKYYKYSVDRKI